MEDEKKEGSYLHAKAIFIHRVDITDVQNGFEVLGHLSSEGITVKKF